MTEAQERTIALVIERAKEDQTIIGVILCGSLARDAGRPDSDVDLFIVVTDEAFQMRRTEKDYFWGTHSDSAPYPVEVDGKIVDKEFLRRLWINGNESIKSTFMDVSLIYSRDAELRSLLERKRDMVDGHKAEKIRKFYALMKSRRYTADDRAAGILLVKRCIFDTVYFACRLVLAHNEVLFPSVKNMEKELLRCPDKPPRFIELMHEVLEKSSSDKLAEFYDHVESFYSAYRFDDRLRKGYVLENELFWYFDTLPYDEL
jgi:predicted nucleotidyltransferase